MIGSQHDWLQMPTLDLYDTQMMLAAVNVAKDMYEKGEEQLKNFYKEYGDFSTPFEKDMARYGEIVGDVLNGLDEIYAAGDDPLRSASGRAKMARLINKINPAEMSNMKSNAKMGYAYLDEILKAIAAGEYDKDFEDFLLTEKGGPGLFKDFSSTGGNKWNRPGPGRFKDLNKWSHHLFDNMELSYDPELSKKYPGYLAYTKSRDTMNTIVDNNIAELLKTNEGRYFLHNIENSIPAEYTGDRRAAAIAELRRRIVDANWEEGQLKLEKDPYYFADYEAKLIERRLRNSGGGSGGGGSKTPKSPVTYDSAEGLFRRGLIKAGGTEGYSDVEKAIEDGRDNIVHRQIALMKQTKQQKMKPSNAVNYILDNVSVEESPINFAKYAQIPIDLKTGTMKITDYLKDRLFDPESVVTHMYGITMNSYDGSTGKKTGQHRMYTNREGLIGKHALPTTKVRTSFTLKANGEYALRQFWKMEIGNIDDDGNFEGNGRYMEFELPTSRRSTHNVPGYLQWKEMNDEDKDIIIRPTLDEDPNTLGWKNTGSMQVNMYEHVPTTIGFPGTANNEAYESE